MLILANLGSPTTYMPAVMSYPWRIYTVRWGYKKYPGEFALCAGDTEMTTFRSITHRNIALGQARLTS
jgi:hypothetical protein